MCIRDSPHTLGVTTLGGLRVGDRVNLEADVVAKHVEHLLAGGSPSPYASLGRTDRPAPTTPDTGAPA